MSTHKGRDPWDIVDLVVKIASTVFLGALIYIIPNASQRIAASLDTGRLVQTLITDLTTSNQQTRQDLALIALNRSVGEHNSQLVSEIAERIYFDLSSRDTLRQGTGRVAFNVLASRDPARAQFVRDSMEAEIDRSRTQAISPPNADSAMTRSVSREAELIARIHHSVVYIQFSAEDERPTARALRETLSAAGFWAPDVDQVDGNFSNWIRYFHASDESLALRARDAVQSFFTQRGDTIPFRVQNMSGRGFKAPEGQIEVWLRLDR